MKHENKRLAKTILLSGIAVFISYMINFILTPYITNRVGIEAYGFVSIAKTAVSYATIITVALTTFIVRFISVDYHKNNMLNANAYYSSSLAACLALSGGIFLIALVIIFRLDYILKIPLELISPVKILFILVFLNFIFTTMATPLSTAGYIKNRLDISSVIKIVSYLCDAGVLFILFIVFKPNVWYIGIGSITAALVNMLGNYTMINKLTPELKFDSKLISIRNVKDMMSNGIWQSLNSLGNVLNSGLDLIIANLMLTAKETGQIAVVKIIGTMFSMLYQVVSQPFQPKLLKIFAVDSGMEFVKELKKSMKICGYFSNIAFSGFIALGQLYYQLWLPAQDTKLLYYLTIVTVFGSITEGIAYPLYYIYTLTLKKKINCFVTIFGGILNTVSMIILLKHTNLGPYCIVITTAVIMTVINLFYNPMYCCKCLGISIWSLYPTIIRHILSAVCMILFFKYISMIISPHGWIELIASAILMCFTGLIIHCIWMADKEDYKELLKRISRIL